MDVVDRTGLISDIPGSDFCLFSVLSRVLTNSGVKVIQINFC